MSVGIDGILGKPIIREGQGIHIFVQRSLRDVFRIVPTFSLEVKVTFMVRFSFTMSIEMCEQIEDSV